MKFYITILLVTCAIFFSKLQAQQKDLSQEMLVKFQISDGTFNGVDITPTLIEQNAYLVIYQTIGSKTLYMANFWNKNNTQSYGKIYAMEKEHIVASDENYEADLFHFQWSYSNTYDTKKGTAKVELLKVYKPQGVYFKMTIIPEDLDVLVYRGFMEGSLDLTIYDRKN
ncbi:MAG: hypothetical protein B7Y83_00400 [Flavobacteriales bacterium 32-34-25]|nr:MAG: hypothetical protein B7Y83_00400 [Flavobacteriales bacterium 32-34-25]